MSAALHHVVMRSHSAQTFVPDRGRRYGGSVPDARAGGDPQQSLGWPPSGGADVTMLGTGDAALVEVLDVPEHLRAIAPEGLAALSFLTDGYGAAREKAAAHAREVTALDTGVPGVDLFFCTMGGVPIEFMGAYAPETNSDASEATNS